MGICNLGQDIVRELYPVRSIDGFPTDQSAFLQLTNLLGRNIPLIHILDGRLAAESVFRQQLGLQIPDSAAAQAGDIAFVEVVQDIIAQGTDKIFGNRVLLHLGRLVIKLRTEQRKNGSIHLDPVKLDPFLGQVLAGYFGKNVTGSPFIDNAGIGFQDDAEGLFPRQEIQASTVLPQERDIQAIILQPGQEILPHRQGKAERRPVIDGEWSLAFIQDREKFVRRNGLIYLIEIVEKGRDPSCILFIEREDFFELINEYTRDRFLVTGGPERGGMEKQPQLARIGDVHRLPIHRRFAFTLV